MSNATLSQFKHLFPATATPSKLSRGKVRVKTKTEIYWDRYTLDDLAKLVDLFGVSGSHLHLSKVEEHCMAVTWLCSTSEVKQLKFAISDNADSFMSKGVQQVFIGEDLLLEYSQSPTVSASGRFY